LASCDGGETGHIACLAEAVTGNPGSIGGARDG
jgi:hypothetical protein